MLADAYAKYSTTHKRIIIENGIIKQGVIDSSINKILEHILVSDRIQVFDLM
jgi:hypothetical protein